ncbi:uncharacterized protein PITG_14348 [Phytophthora infestans T30-4]|uniref:Uncharacterized protein n=1 Tax=Phytophthora infestans (strain T30-4) TaxID=403677 RepID=D0NPM1_PHYIT|nr:uncharacterized protein PITG_14348 [Phytophthora infestans T30-4]EEY62583.1 hypothetical protein PITG_14348 [Phytophthora infestans T30-4]|eukprot:XP_002898825.1 hypothetical protein PITG_14348 [Phytophthora infestans T30-4]
MTYTPEQYQLHKERIRAAQKRYYLKTRETRLAYQKGYDDKNRDYIRSRKRKPKDELNESVEREPNTETELS